jgi:predicted transcriptional regulator
MNELNKKDRLKYLLEMILNNNITAYEIGVSKNLNISALDKIIKGITKNPQNSTLDAIEDYISEKLLVQDVQSVNEKPTEYNMIKKLQFNHDDVANYVIENEDELLKNKKFAIWYKNIILKAQVDMLKDELKKK